MIADIRMRYLIVILLLALTASAVSALQYDASQDEAIGLIDLKKIPLNVGQWKGQDIPLDEKVYNILETKEILHRTYRDQHGNSIVLSIVHYNDTKVDFHVPEACLGGLGERTSKKIKRIELSVDNKKMPLEVAEILAKGIRSRSVSYYFYKTGDFMGQNYIKMRLNLAKNKLLRRDSSGSLIRFTATHGNDSERKEKEKNINRFMQEMMPLIIKEL